MGVPLPTERHLLIARDCRFRRQQAEAEEMGHRTFDRCLWFRWTESADRGVEVAWRRTGIDPGLYQQLAGLHAGGARHQEVRRRRDRYLYDEFPGSRHICQATAPAWRNCHLDRLAVDCHGYGHEARGRLAA